MAVKNMLLALHMLFFEYYTLVVLFHQSEIVLKDSKGFV